jgi:hypothetical protein
MILRKYYKMFKIIVFLVFAKNSMACDRPTIELDSLINHSDIILSATVYSISRDSNYRHVAKLKKVICYKGNCPDTLVLARRLGNCETVITEIDPYLLFLKWDGIKYTDASSWVGVWKESRKKVFKRIESYYSYNYPIAWVKLNDHQIEIVNDGIDQKYGFNKRIILAKSLKKFLMKIK